MVFSYRINTFDTFLVLMTIQTKEIKHEINYFLDILKTPHRSSRQSNNPVQIRMG